MNEICFNLWYYLAEDQTIIALAARHYFLRGEERDKVSTLEALSYNDFRLVPERPLPSSLLREHRGRVHYSVLMDRGIDMVYDELFQEIRAMIPHEIPFPEDKLFFATPLFDFGEGFTPAVIADGFIKSK